MMTVSTSPLRKPAALLAISALAALALQLIAPTNAAAALGPPVFGPPTETGRVGAATGAQVTADCPSPGGVSELLGAIVVTVNANGWVSRAHVTCGDLVVTPTMVELGTFENGPSISGFRDPVQYEFAAASACPENAAVVGIQGRGGALVDGVQLLCRDLRADGTLDENMYATSFAGGPGGSAQGPFMCPTNAVATGIVAGIGEDVDSIGLTCRVLGFPSTTPEDINVTWPTALPVSGTSTTAGALTAPGQERWYRFPVLPGSRVQVDLTGLPADYDVTLFKDIAQSFTELTTTADLTQLSAEFAADAFSPSVFSPSVFSPSVFSPSVFSPSVFSPSVFSPSVFSPSVFSPSVFSPSVFSPSVFSPSVFSPSVFSPAVSLPSVFSPSVFSPSVFSPSVFSEAFSSAQSRSLIGVSARDGTSPESISSATWTNTGNFYVRVSGRNGASSSEQYSLTVTTTGGPCESPLADHATDDTIVGTPGGAQTVILTDPQRMPGTAAEKSALQQALASLATRTNGVVLDLAGSAKVSALNTQADSPTHVSCPYAKNLVAQAVRDIVNSYRDTQGTLKYVVVVGDDSVVPFFRYADGAGLGPESDYVPPVADSTASQASLRSNYVLSQDAYGAEVDISVKGAQLPVPDLAVGRLVETAAEVTSLVNVFLARNGAPLAPTTTLATGYDFLTDAADSVAASFAQGIPGGQHSTLITDADVPPSTTTVNGVPDRRHSWTAADLRTRLFGSRHDLVFLAGHFSANSTLAADYDTTVLSTEVLNTPRSVFENTLIFSAGCHSGYTIVDQEGIPGVTVGLDWTQAFARQGATLIAGTGYQYGDTDFLEYSERLYADFARQLRLGTDAVSVGQALTEAKQSYLAATPTLRGIDTKAMLEATLYGLPMFGVNLPAAGRLNPPADNPVVTPALVPAGPGNVLGLQVGQLNLNPTLQTVTRPLTNIEGGSVTATHLIGPAGVETNPAEPALPLVTANVTAPGQVLRGVGFRGGTYTDTDGITPLTGSPATETHSVHTPFVSPAFFPSRLANPNYFDSLGSANGGITRLMVTPAQHRSDAPGSLTNTLRRYSQLGLRLYYSSNIATFGENTPALAAAPTITDVDATTDGSVRFQARAVGDPSAGIQEVWVTYTSERGGPLYGQWTSLDLTQDPVDSTLWTGSLTPPAGQDPAAIRYFVQAANGVGLVGLDDNQGVYFTPGVTAGVINPSAVDTALTFGAGIPATGAYGATLPVSARLTTDGGAGVAGRLVTFSLGGASRTAFTDSSGLASTQLPVSVVPGPYSLTASFDGDAGFVSSAATPKPFTVGKQATTLNLVRNGTTLSATLLGATGLPLREKTVFFVTRSSAGAVLGGTSVITDRSGIAELGTAQLPATATTVTAYFGSATTPLPNGQTADLSDPSYAAATSAAVALAPANTAPTAAPDSYTFVGGTVLSVPVPGVLGNDSDPQGDPLRATLVSGPANGGLILRPDGSFTYTPTGDFVGVDSFRYTASDGVLPSAAATVTITVTEPRPPGCTIVGTPGNDTLTGGNGNDVICGLGGNDVLTGGNGDDRLYGGSGNDRLDGGNGRDNLQGAAGTDTLVGGNDNDTMDGGSGNDSLNGGNGNDTMDGGPGNDSLDGGNDNDTIVAGTGTDQLLGGNNNDSLNSVDGVGGDSNNGGTGTDSCVRDPGDTATSCP